MKERADLVVHGCGMLATLSGPARPRVGREMSDLGVIENGAVAIRDGGVAETGSSEDIMRRYAAAATVDAKGGLVLPGFVDCHTHLVYAGSRENELAARLRGATYLEILESGGGIHATVRGTRDAAPEELFRLGARRLDRMLAHGTTTVEVKSGYGLDMATERKILETAAALDERHPVDVVRTFLGAHVVPEGVERSAYVAWLVDEALPQLVDRAEFCDVFCEEGAFTLDETRRILEAAGSLGYGLKVHAGQFTDLGAAGLAAEMGARSADHLEFVSSEQIEMMKTSATVAVLLPGSAFFLASDTYPSARGMIDAGVPVALATDFNPGSCPAFSMQMMIVLACLKMKMTPEEAVSAATMNAAWAIGKAARCGSLERGKQADLIVLDVPSPAFLPYHFGGNLVRRVIKRGRNVPPRAQ